MEIDLGYVSFGYKVWREWQRWVVGVVMLPQINGANLEEEGVRIF